MDYEEKYKQALDRASKLRVQNPFDTVGQMVEHIFPELKVSEGESIRNGIIALLQFGLEDGSAIAPGFNVTKEQALAWIEKQKNTTDKEYVFRPAAGDTIEKAAERAVELDGKVVLAFNGAYIPVGNKTKDEIVEEYRNWIEKQSEQKTVEWREADEKMRKWIIDDIRYNINNEPLNNSEYKKKAEKAIAWLERQDHMLDAYKVIGVT